MKRNINRDKLVCGVLSLILAAGMTQGCASPHVSDQPNNQNTHETGEEQTPSYSYENNDAAGGGPAPAESNSEAGAGKKKSPEEEKAAAASTKDKTGQEKDDSDTSSGDEKTKTDNKEDNKAENKTENKKRPSSGEKIEAARPDPSDKDKNGKDDAGIIDPYEEYDDPDDTDWQEDEEYDDTEEGIEDREYYDSDSSAEYETVDEEDYIEEDYTGEDSTGEITDDIAEDGTEAADPEEIADAEKEAATEDASLGEVQVMPEDTPEEPVYDILSYISSIESVESLVGLLEMYEAEPRMLGEYEDVKAFEKDSLHIEFSYSGSRIYISNDGNILPNIVNVTAGSSLLGEDYNSLGTFLEAQGWTPEASEIDPSEPVNAAAYSHSINGMDLLFTIYFGEDNKINNWTIDNLQQ